MGILSRRDSGSWLLLSEGLFGLGVADLIARARDIDLFRYLFLIGCLATAKGVLEIFAAIRVRKDIKEEWVLTLAGSTSLVLGIILMPQAGTGTMAQLWLPFYGFFFGWLLVVASFKARGWQAC